jgi:hypothetical protein
LSSFETIAGAPETIGATRAIVVVTPKMSLKKAGMVDYAAARKRRIVGM